MRVKEFYRDKEEELSLYVKGRVITSSYNSNRKDYHSQKLRRITWDSAMYSKQSLSLAECQCIFCNIALQEKNLVQLMFNHSESWN